MTSYTFLMQNPKYNLWQDENGWRGYLEGYPQYEIRGESFEELQLKLWQLHQDLIADEWNSSHSREREQDYPEQGEGSTPRHQRTYSRCDPQLRARVEQLMLAMISTLNAT